MLSAPGSCPDEPIWATEADRVHAAKLSQDVSAAHELN